MTAEVSLQSIPKVQLHCHLEGTLRAATFIDLARRHGVALTYRRGEASGTLPAVDAPVDPEGVYRFANFQEFLMTFAAVSRSLAEPADYERLAAEYVEDALEHNVMYAELFISPSVWRFFNPEIDARTCIAAMRRAFDAVRDRLEIALIADVTRNFGTESAMQTAREAVELQELGVIGIGLGGDEARFPAELFEDVYAFARKERLRCVAHAGEAAGAQSVRAAVEVLGAERIGHGVRALEDESVVQLLKRNGIPLECAPTSNVLTGVVDADAEHPLVRLDELGVIVTVDADDPALFGTTITRELEIVERMVGRHDTLRFIRNAIDAAFAPADRKAALHRRLEPYVQYVGP
jgi:adenosine deaminase